MRALISILLGPVGRHGAILLLIVGAYWYIDHRGYQRGFETAMSAVRAQNEKAAAVAEKAIRDVDDCFAKGGTWRVETGDCDL